MDTVGPRPNEETDYFLTRCVVVPELCEINGAVEVSTRLATRRDMQLFSSRPAYKAVAERGNLCLVIVSFEQKAIS